MIITLTPSGAASSKVRLLKPETLRHEGEWKFLRNGVLWLALFSLILGCRSHPGRTDGMQRSSEAIAVSAPPESFFQIVRERDRDAARQFYGKYISVDGMPVVASRTVADPALQRTHWLVKHLLAGRPDIAQTMVSNGMYLIIIGKDQVYTDMPEYRNSSNPDYLNERVRGTGGKPTSFGEENLLCLPLDRYDDESIGLHEFCHTIDGALRSMDPTWNQRKGAVFRNAIEKGLWKNAYGGSNAGEYWAEICQSYFDCNRVNNWNHNAIGTREQLQAYDPEAYELVRSTFNLTGELDWRYSPMQKQPSVIAPPAKFKIDPYYTKVTWAREFPVVGRRASDAALLRANDTVRKMFAYRHDVLKTLIANDLKLVVLGRREKLSDLPEFAELKTLPGVTAASRQVNYLPGAKVLVVAEENILDEPKPGSVGNCEVICQFARALYFQTCLRPVDPDWNNRGRNVQQYELRVKRLDVQFDEKLKQIYQARTADKPGQGTAVGQDQVTYWASGVMAYFDAGCAEPMSQHSLSAMATREALREQDPALFELVQETMAYEGKEDWRYRVVKSVVAQR
jgi:hypothetical protein